MYTVMIADDGMFSAEYVVPPALSIPLGASGSTVDVVRNEDGTFSANGEIVTAETMVTAENGNVYAAVLSPEGVPVGVMHVAAMQDVMLGDFGGTVTLTQAEDMAWSIQGEPIMSGGEVTSSGRTYTVTQDAEGMWSAMYKPVYRDVALITQGSITLELAEDMTWWHDTDSVPTDGSYETMSDNGNTYTLWYTTDGVWSARFEPESMMIEGTGLVAMTREGDDHYDVADGLVGTSGDPLPSTGVGDVMDGDAMYHVWMEDDALMGARFDAALHGDSDDPAFGIVGDLRMAGHLTNGTDDDAGADILPVLSSDDEDTAANELRTMLKLADSSFSIADLLDSGMAADMGDNFVVNARKGVEEVRDYLDALLSLTEDPPGLSGLLTTAWARVQTQVNSVFGTGKIDLGGRPREDDIMDEIDDILDALSSGPAFAAATMEDGNGVFEDAALSEADALKAFDAAESQATVVFGTTGATRYGAITATERDTATADLDYRMGASLGNGDVDDTSTDEVDEGDMGLIGAFSYSTIDDVQRVWHVATRGSAYYEGGTTAVSGDGQLYTGDIAIEVRFSSDRVSGLVTNLMTTGGDPWSYQYGEVDSIVLAAATNLNQNAHWSTADAEDAAGSARITFASRAGSPLPQPIRGAFQGQLLGRGATDDPSANGTHAHGTWSVGTQTNSGSAAYLAGGFGAERVGHVGDGPRPGTDDGSVHETVVTSSDGVVDTDLRNSFKLDGGNLVVTMNRYGRYLEDTANTNIPDDTSERTVFGAATDPPAGSGAAVATAADQLFVLDSDLSTSDLENETHELKQSLADVMANQQSDRNVNAPDKQLAIVVRELETARGALEVLQGLNIRHDDAEQLAWRRVQAALLRIFHHVPPKLAEAYTEDDALGLIDQALDAFSSSDNLEDALDRNGRGIFNDVTKADGTTLPGAGLIWGRQEVQMKTHGGATDYTRWGVWRVRTDRYAARDAWTQPVVGDGNGNEPGSYAYSQLLPTTWTDQNDPGFPGSGSAIFMGGTTAIQGTNFLDGDIMVTAEWDSTWDGTDEDALGTLSMRITNMADTDGDPLLDASLNEFYALVVTGVEIRTNADNQVVFNSVATSSGEFKGLTGVQGLTDTTLDGANTMGKFVGQDVEGPLGVIGTYNIGAGNFTGAALRGSFGADRP